MKDSKETKINNKLDIITYGNPILRKKAAEIKNITDEIIKIAEDMIFTMHSAPGIGLAAPQINKSKRLITIDLSVGEKKEDLIVLINPKIIHEEGQDTAEEGCLSVPGINENVPRSFRLECAGYDLSGKEKRVEAEGLLARVISHEVDHINGILFIDHLSPLKKGIIRKKLKKQ
jgi:peptide deformylase